MAEEAVAIVEALVVGMVEASAVVAISVAGISQVAVVISLGLVGVGLAAIASVAIALRNTEEGISITEIVSGTIVISFLEVPSGMMTPTTSMIIIRTTDIRTMDIGTTGFTASCSNPVDKLSIAWPDRRSEIEAAARRLRCYS